VCLLRVAGGGRQVCGGNCFLGNDTMTVNGLPARQQRLCACCNCCDTFTSLARLSTTNSVMAKQHCICSAVHADWCCMHVPLTRAAAFTDLNCGSTRSATTSA
jgi:hypothetical protein